MSGSTVFVIIVIILICISAGSSSSGSNKRRSEYSKTPHLWYGTTENGDCYIDIRKYIIYAPLEQCPPEWKKAELFTAVAAFIRPNSNIVYKKFKARLCENDSLYYLTDAEFKRVSGTDRLLGQVMPLPNYRKMKSEMMKYSGKYDLAEESKFKLFGYNVGAKDGFSPQYRQKVLMFIIESGLSSKYEAINHLDFNINNHAHNPSNRLAISKWEADRMFLSNYSFDDANVNWVTVSNPPEVEAVPPARATQNQKAKVEKSQKSSKTPANIKDQPVSCAISPGDSVNHKAFGCGIVERIDYNNNHIYIDFDGQVKRLSLKKIGDFLL